MGQETGNGHGLTLGRVLRDIGGAGARGIDPSPRLHHVHDQQPDRQGQCGDHLEIEQRLEPDSAHPLEVCGLGDA